ncbi:uncharacterized protein BKA55DRAFT_738728 [Fusarium redolens]|uniref:Uncharacterized protein n=1 Tax=Fusarium redolens TaxID=48865 RepID=A0A9P9H117_FUSRE|nr:uncharacterized protein BKA55DRAFT_738728 [Fusarium redolens]KAH7248522.1 hypothetical protein BKA55DRAFT_738728 [Fusarium redolens]
MSEDLEDHQTSQATPGEVIVDPSVDAPATRSWMMLDNVSSAPKFLLSASPALIALLNNQEYLSMQVSKLTEMVAELKVGPRSRRSSASSRKSGDSDVTNIITTNEAADALNHQPINVRRGKKTLEYGRKFQDAAGEMLKESWNPETLDDTLARLQSLEDHQVIRLYNGLSQKFRDQKAQGKKDIVQTRTESFQTDIKGGPTTPGRRGETREHETSDLRSQDIKNN